VSGWSWSLLGLIRYWSQHLDGEPGVEAGLGPMLLGFRLLVLGFAVMAGLRLAWLRIPAVLLPRACRTLLYCVPVAIVVASLASPGCMPTSPQWPVQSIFLASVTTAQTLWALLWIRRPGWAADLPARGFEWTDLALGNALLLLVLSETLLAVWGGLRPSPLVFHESVASSLDAHRLPGHQPFHRGRLNRGGFADDEFFRTEGEDVVIAVIGDSFGLGIVPIPQNYVSVAERALRATRAERPGRLALHNFGVPAVGLPEYAQLLRTEVEAWIPSIVVVSVFVGNDIHQGLSFTRPRARRYRFQQWLIWNVARRASSLLRAGRAETDRLLQIEDATKPGIEERQEGAGATSPESTFSEARFLEIEQSRLAITRADDAEALAGYEQFFAGLDYFERRLGDSLVIAIIPDEFQVNDELWRAVGGEVAGFDRELPQRRILSFCKKRRIECIDFLSALRDAERDRPTYRARDTHWNEWGNEVAGLGLAERLRVLLEKRRSS
jgi:hypothetical protein